MTSLLERVQLLSVKLWVSFTHMVTQLSMMHWLDLHKTLRSTVRLLTDMATLVRSTETHQLHLVTPRQDLLRLQVRCLMVSTKRLLTFIQTLTAEKCNQSYFQVDFQTYLSMARTVLLSAWQQTLLHTICVRLLMA